MLPWSVCNFGHSSNLNGDALGALRLVRLRDSTRYDHVPELTALAKMALNMQQQATAELFTKGCLLDDHSVARMRSEMYWPFKPIRVHELNEDDPGRQSREIFIREFPVKWVGRRRSTSLLVHSTDLTDCDYWFRGYLKEARNPGDVDISKTTFETTTRAIRLLHKARSKAKAKFTTLSPSLFLVLNTQSPCTLFNNHPSVLVPTWPFRSPPTKTLSSADMPLTLQVPETALSRGVHGVCVVVNSSTFPLRRDGFVLALKGSGGGLAKTRQRWSWSPNGRLVSGRGLEAKGRNTVISHLPPAGDVAEFRAIEERVNSGREVCDCKYPAVKDAAGRLDYWTRYLSERLPLKYGFKTRQDICNRSSGHVPATCPLFSKRGRHSVVVRLLASHLCEPCSIPGGVAPGFPHVRIMPEDATGRRVFSGISCFHRPCIPALFHTHLAPPSSSLKTSIISSAQNLSTPPSNSESGTRPVPEPRGSQPVNGSVRIERTTVPFHYCVLYVCNPFTCMVRAVLGSVLIVIAVMIAIVVLIMVLFAIAVLIVMLIYGKIDPCRLTLAN
ncbi:hypothetical protein PR048_023337 [Dryococelus australis]|uniref:Uncharacterized protein n=1 Tax=Dryococelus australis TaxID=614101 RepID=A0ABQ9GTU4_9NEOP|nr:hypothetical protein PR048_023337 [Dryococelus australis]